MEAFEIGDFWLVSRFDQRLEGHFYQRADASAKDGLLAEEIAFGLFFESRFDNACFEVACSPRIRERVLLRLTAGILMNGQKARHAHTFNKQLTHTMPGRFRGNHRDVNKRRRRDPAEMDVETMSKHQGLTFAKMRLNGRLIDSPLLLIRNEDHDHV